MVVPLTFNDDLFARGAVIFSSILLLLKNCFIHARLCFRHKTGKFVEKYLQFLKRKYCLFYFPLNRTKGTFYYPCDQRATSLSGSYFTLSIDSTES